MNTKFEICFLSDFPSLLEGIFALTGLSKNQVFKFISKKECKQKVYAQKVYLISSNILNYGRVNSSYSGPHIPLVFEDEFFTVLSKPPRIHCHPLSFDERDNVLSFLAQTKPQLIKVNENDYDRGLFYRIDYETSGLLYFAKSDDIQNRMRSEFEDRVQSKKYLAVVTGRVDKEGHLKHRLESFEENNKMVRVSEKGKECECSFTCLDYNSELDASLILLELKQGFRHQLRVQLAAFGHAILGDPLYNGRPYERLMLHCYQYIFTYQNRNYDLKSEWEELKSLFTYFNGKF
jgi:23S rRNA pseudouridine1911/1915/1917 synthase